MTFPFVIHGFDENDNINFPIFYIHTRVSRKFYDRIYVFYWVVNTKAKYQIYLPFFYIHTQNKFILFKRNEKKKNKIKEMRVTHILYI